MSAPLAIVLLAGGLALVVAGAELFLDGLVHSASRLRLPAFSIGVVVSGFELENLAAGIAANAKGLPGVAAGTFLGGTTFLAIGVSGLAALIAPIRADLPLRALAWTAAAPLPLLALGLDGRLSRLDGILLLLWFAIALTGLARVGRMLTEPPVERLRRRPILRLLAGLSVLTAGGAVLAEGLRGAVERLGIPQTLLGNTIVAASVEAEEVVRVVVPSRRGRGDLAVANIAGTIVHFTAFNAGVIALIKPLALDSVTRHLHLPAAIVATFILCSALRAGSGISRATGAMLLTVYIAYLAATITAA